MRTVKLFVTEKLEYRREIEVNIPDDMGEDELETILDAAERNYDTLDDFMHEVRDNGIDCHDWDTDLSSPDWMDIECDEYEIVEEGKLKFA